jgi:hypothetical protein
MATICPFASWRPLPEATSQPAITPRVVIFHTMVGSLAGTERHFRDQTGIESHFGVGGPTDGPDLDGTLWQWMDLDRQADANLNANSFAISVETSDGGDPDRPWSDRQLATLVRLGNWLADHYGIPRRQCPAWDRSGFGWHVMFGAPGPWTPVAKTCPGPVRIRQLREVVFPAVFAGTQLEDDMPLTDTDLDAVERRVVRALNRVASSEADPESLGEAKLADDGTGSPFRTGVGELTRRAVDPLLDDEAKVLAAVGAVTDAVGSSRAAILGALAALNLDLSPEQITAIAAAVDVDEAAVAEAVRFRLSEALAG